MGLFNNGIAEVLFADIAADGGAGTTFKALGKTLEGSFKILTEDGTTTTFKSEETDDPEFEVTRGGSLGFEFQLMDPDADALVAIFKGTKTADGGYEPPDKTATVEKSFKVVPEMGLGFNVVRAKITGKFTDAMGKNALMGIIVTVKIMTPTKAGVKKFTMPKYPLATTP
ncbi:hypothetical protein ELBR111191_14470 [Elizabethkingia bruuniana]|uniref:hypothetical protein n=1 Tax=Elizabethkingia bruuniana TaxID=1756149 RepID=UPI0009990AE5|nr:hypothetical protein [Elizabethkingia bruuniana]AQX84047.1 hypothetical protein AYC65_02990 [Elizabethkingia bruuniana]MDV3490928.1 hypothetical protein [Elizabethkingia anophelis]OPB64468.1 hypothetical protein BAY12_06630 [Elizabethkingia bruuniana]